mgnify:CR=1 FL=1
MDLTNRRFTKIKGPQRERQTEGNPGIKGRHKASNVSREMGRKKKERRREE